MARAGQGGRVYTGRHRITHQGQKATNLRQAWPQQSAEWEFRPIDHSPRTDERPPIRGCVRPRITPDDATAVPEAQEIFKLYLEAKRKPDDGSGNTDRILASIETIDALSMPTTGKIRKCHECQEVVAADGEESNCTDDCETQCPGGAWLAKHANYRVGKDPRTKELFSTSWAFGTTPGAPPLKIKGLRIDKETLAGSMMPEQEDDA